MAHVPSHCTPTTVAQLSTLLLNPEGLSHSSKLRWTGEQSKSAKIGGLFSERRTLKTLPPEITEKRKKGKFDVKAVFMNTQC